MANTFKQEPNHEKWQFSPKQYSSISLKTTKKEVEIPIFMKNNSFYYLSRPIPRNLRTLTAKILE